MLLRVPSSTSLGDIRPKVRHCHRQVFLKNTHLTATLKIVKADALPKELASRRVAVLIAMAAAWESADTGKPVGVFNEFGMWKLR